jgi:putative ABC transport system permease protein
MVVSRGVYTRSVIAIAFGSLLQHRLRSMLSIFGIICGVAAVFAILSIGEGAKREVLAGIAQLGLDNVIVRGNSLSSAMTSEPGSKRVHLSKDDVSFLTGGALPIKESAYLKEVNSARVSGRDSEISPQILASSANYLQLLGFSSVSGRLFLPDDETHDNQVCILGMSLSRKLGSTGKVGARLRIDDQIFKVVGLVQADPAGERKKNRAVVPRSVNDLLFIPFGSHVYLNTTAVTTDGGWVDEIVLKFNNSETAETILPLVHRTLQLHHSGSDDYQIIVPRQLLRQAKHTQRIFNLVLGAIGGISLLVGGIGVMNVLLATVSERTREIGLRRAVGASRKDIIVQFLAESILLTTLGGFFGIVAGLLCSWLIARFAGWSIAITPYCVLVPLITSVAVGICFGLYPAFKAADMDPVEALRSA